MTDVDQFFTFASKEVLDRNSSSFRNDSRYVIARHSIVKHRKGALRVLLLQFAILGKLAF